MTSKNWGAIDIKYLITGSAGFVGSNYLRYALNKYPRDYFICLDALTHSGNYNNIKDLKLRNNFKFIYGSITNRELVDKIFKDEQIDIVINFAAENHVDHSILNPSIFIETNIVGTQILLDAALKYNVKRFHQVSTDEVYGDLPLEGKNDAFTEESLIRPSSPYSASKAAADLLVMAYYRTFNLPVTISRSSNNYGPYQFIESLIPLIITKALKNESIPIYGKGNNVRDWVHVHDHVIGIDLIIQKGRVGQIYNLGGNSQRTNLEVAEIILKQMRKSKDLITHVEDRQGHDQRYAIDSAKIENELGWNRTYTFEDALSETINWYLNNQQWIKDIQSGD